MTKGAITVIAASATAMFSGTLALMAIGMVASGVEPKELPTP